MYQKQLEFKFESTIVLNVNIYTYKITTEDTENTEGGCPYSLYSVFSVLSVVKFSPEIGEGFVSLTINLNLSKSECSKIRLYRKFRGS